MMKIIHFVNLVQLIEYTSSGYLSLIVKPLAGFSSYLAADLDVDGIVDSETTCLREILPKLCPSNPVLKVSNPTRCFAHLETCATNNRGNSFIFEGTPRDFASFNLSRSYNGQEIEVYISCMKYFYVDGMRVHEDQTIHLKWDRTREKVNKYYSWNSGTPSLQWNITCMTSFECVGSTRTPPLSTGSTIAEMTGKESIIITTPTSLSSQVIAGSTTINDVKSDNQSIVYIIPSCIGGVIVTTAIIVVLLLVYKRKKPERRSQPNVQPDSLNHYSNEYRDPTYDHLRDRVRNFKYDSTYESRDIPIYDRAQDSSEYHILENPCTASVDSSLPGTGPNLRYSTYSTVDESQFGHPSQNSDEQTHSCSQEQTTPILADLYAKVVKIKLKDSAGDGSLVQTEIEPQTPVKDFKLPSNEGAESEI